MKSYLTRLLSIAILFFSSHALISAQTNLRGVPDGFAELSTRLSPAVVNISTSQNVDVSEDVPSFPEGSPLERFNDFFGDRNNLNGRISKSLGSGFVIDPDGYIVTNNHVIEDSDLIEVVFPNGDTFEAELIGRDLSTDLALLKIESRDPFPHVEFGDSDTADVGDWVIAIGNPLGYGGSVAAGIISARNRQINQGNYDDFIQSDVAINRGNSGGPLFNMEGDVIGVNTAIASPTGFSVGISFSIPSDLAQSVIAQLREFGETRRGRLGVRVQEVSPEIARSYRLDDARGALVTYVAPDSPAAKAELKVGDIILKIGERTIENQRALFRIVAESEIGADMPILVNRKRQEQTLSVTIERLPEEVVRAEREAAEAAEASGEAIMGLVVESLTDKTRREYRLRLDAAGVRVKEVLSTSPAAGKILSGDIIEEVNFEATQTRTEFETAVTNAEDDDRPVTFLINRNGNYVVYALPVA